LKKGTVQDGTPRKRKRKELMRIEMMWKKKRLWN
jgi:hypothetical protein